MKINALFRSATEGWSRLSFRLIVLTLLWVCFVILTIGYTMMLSWHISEYAAIETTISDLRSQVFRSHMMVDHRHSDADFQRQCERVEQLLLSLHRFEATGQALVLPVRFNETQSKCMEQIEREWKNTISPGLRTARTAQHIVTSRKLDIFAEQIAVLAYSVSQNRHQLSELMQYIQIGLMILSVLSLFAIVWLLNRLVITPTESLLRGIQAVTRGNLKTRLKLSGSRDFKRIGIGFNRMTSRLEDFVENLEAKVAEKTLAVETHNRILSELYDFSTFLASSTSVDEITEGASERLLQYAHADGSAVFLAKNEHADFELVASQNLPETLFTDLYRKKHSRAELEPFFESSQTKRFSDDQALPGRVHFIQQAGLTAGYRTLCLFSLRSISGVIGFYVLFYKDTPDIDSATLRHYESFAQHLCSAITNCRLTETNNQLAVIHERNMMARSLHDSIAQTLSYLNLQVQLLQTGLKTDDTEFVNDTVESIKQGVQQSYDDIRELLLNFRERIREENFTDAIHTVIDRFESQTHIKAQIYVHGKGYDLLGSQRLQVIFIMQEALANVRKHSMATEVRIDIDYARDFSLTVTDNGIGIDPAIVVDRSATHVGLNIMHERSEKIGALVFVGTAPRDIYERGTMVRLKIPAARLDVVA